MTLEAPDRPPVFRGARSIVYLSFGCMFLGIGALGAVLPILPTTPFVLLASFFFVRSSPRLNDWLLRSPLFGPFLRDWRDHRGVRPRVKFIAVTVVLTTIAASVVWGELWWPMQVLLLVLAAVGLTVVLLLQPFAKHHDRHARESRRATRRSYLSFQLPQCMCGSLGEVAVGG